MLGALLALAALGCAGAAKDLEFVEEVGPANYDNFLLSASEEKQWVLLEFYAPWCDHCKAMAPILDEFAGKHPGVRVAKIDATRNKQLAKDHRIEGYPTLRWRGVGAHKFREYKGGRDLESLDRIDARL
ncbi:thioredoxin-like protein, partial [Pelagophyceae sp. CCMP2097]